MPRSSVLARTRALAATAVLTTAGFAASVGAAAPAAHATVTTTKAQRDAAAAHEEKANKVLHWAAEQKGKPYRYGAAGPSAFDCSGLVRYVFGKALSKSLPHNAQQQYDDSQHINKSSLKIGDLIFVRSGGSITHVGIFAGNGYWWVAPHSGTRVQKQKIYSASFVYGRIIH